MIYYECWWKHAKREFSMFTDYIIIIALIFLFFKGWNKGFLKILVGPASLIAGCFVGFIYYQKTHNIPLSLGICIIGPFIINVTILIGLKILHKAGDDKPPKLPVSSRLLGSAVSILWGGSYLVFILLIIGMIPLQLPAVRKAQYDVLHSRSYGLIASLTKNKIPATHYDLNKIQKFFEDPSQIEKFEDTKEYKDLVSDEHLAAILADEQTIEQFRSKNYTELLANPRVQELFNDEDLLKKIFALNKRIMEGEPIDGEKTATPKTINVK